MNFKSIIITSLALLGTSILSITAFGRNACEPVTNYSCEAWQEQAQIGGNISEATESVIDGQTVCDLKVFATHFTAHILCPLYQSNKIVRFQTCGKCPEVGSEIFGVVMREESGLTVIDR